jgi:predicted nucleic acid-binding protein
MIGLDCNILVQLAFADHAANSKTIAAVQTETQKGEKLVFPSLVVAEFLHVATDARRFAGIVWGYDRGAPARSFLDELFGAS